MMAVCLSAGVLSGESCDSESCAAAFGDCRPDTVRTGTECGENGGLMNLELTVNGTLNNGAQVSAVGSEWDCCTGRNSGGRTGSGRRSDFIESVPYWTAILDWSWQTVRTGCFMGLTISESPMRWQRLYCRAGAADAGAYRGQNECTALITSLWFLGMGLEQGY